MKTTILTSAAAALVGLLTVTGSVEAQNFGHGGYGVRHVKSDAIVLQRQANRLLFATSHLQGRGPRVQELQAHAEQLYRMTNRIDRIANGNGRFGNQQNVRHGPGGPSMANRVNIVATNLDELIHHMQRDIRQIKANLLERGVGFPGQQGPIGRTGPNNPVIFGSGRGAVCNSAPGFNSGRHAYNALVAQRLASLERIRWNLNRMQRTVHHVVNETNVAQQYGNGQVGRRR